MVQISHVQAGFGGVTWFAVVRESGEGSLARAMACKSSRGSPSETEMGLGESPAGVHTFNHLLAVPEERVAPAL